MGVGTSSDAVGQARVIDETHVLLAGRDSSDNTLSRLDLFMWLLVGSASQLHSAARCADMPCNTGDLMYISAEAAIRAVRYASFARDRVITSHWSICVSVYDNE